MISPRPVTLEANGIRLEPLSKEHRDGLDKAAADGRLWELFFTSVPAPGETEAYRVMGSLAFAKLLLEKAKVCVSPGIGFGDHGDDHVRFALIENEARIRQAVRGIRAMLKADGQAEPLQA